MHERAYPLPRWPAAINCPVEPVQSNAAVNTAELLDKPLAVARSIAERHGCSIVVTVRDGGGAPVPLDPVPKRILVYAGNGIVIDIKGVGGGL